MEYVLCVNNRYFKIDIPEEGFLEFLQQESKKDFETECVSEKELLSAYIKKTSELFEKEKKIKQLFEKLELDLSKTSV